VRAPPLSAVSTSVPPDAATTIIRPELDDAIRMTPWELQLPPPKPLPTAVCKRSAIGIGWPPCVSIFLSLPA